jgi:hypothetical protein
MRIGVPHFDIAGGQLLSPGGPSRPTERSCGLLLTPIAHILIYLASQNL